MFAFQGRRNVCSYTSIGVGALQLIPGLHHLSDISCGSRHGVLHTLLGLCHRLSHARFSAGAPGLL